MKKLIVTTCLLTTACLPNHSHGETDFWITPEEERVMQMTDQTTLAEIATSNQDTNLRMIAIVKLQNQTILAQVAQNKNNEIPLRQVALKKINEAAEKGDVKAQYRLSVWYLNGTGFEKNVKTSVEWYKKALAQDASLDTQETMDILRSITKTAEQDDAEAQYIFGMCNEHASGFYVEAKRTVYHKDGSYTYGPNLTEALTWFEKSATLGYAPAQYEVGLRYGFKQKYTEAVKLFEKAAEQGYMLAQEKLANYYRNGLGVDKNETKAIEWYTKAADQGNLLARNQLAEL